MLKEFKKDVKLPPAAQLGVQTTQNVPSYDASTDYSALMKQAEQAGNWQDAAKYEQQRNAKIDAEGLDYSKSNDYAAYLPFESGYDAHLNDLYEQIVNRPKFQYDMDEDMLYQQYADQYMRQGKLAMQDTMGQAAALTGGYGSSYGQQVGQQAYNAYLQQLNAVVPELYGQAADRYNNETNALLQQYSLAGDLRDREYQQYQDNYARQYAQDEAGYARQQSAYENLVAMMTGIGYQPSEAEKAAAGMSEQQAQAYGAYWTKANQSSSRYYNPDEDENTKIPTLEEMYGLAARYRVGGINAVSGDIDYYEKDGYDADWIFNWLNQYGKTAKTPEQKVGEDEQDPAVAYKK